MSNRYFILALIIMIFCAASSASAEAPTLEELLIQAVKQNKTLLASEHRLQKTVFSAKASLSSSRLQTTLNSAFYRNKEDAGGLVPKNGEQIGFSILQPLDISGYLSMQDKIARINIEAERVNYLTDLNNILPTLAQLYVQSVWAKDAIKSLNGILSSRENNYKATEAMYEKQAVGKLDYLRAGTNVEQIKAQMKDYEVQYATYMEGIASLLDGDRVQIPESLSDISFADSKENEADIKNPELEALSLAKRAAMLKKRSSELEHAPTLNVNISYNPYRENRAKSDYDELTGGLYLSLPIFNGGKTKNAAASYAEEIKELEKSYEAKKLELEADLSAYREHLTIYEKQAKIWDSQRKVAKQKMEIANELYLSGMISQTDLLTVMDEQQTAEINYLSAVLNKKLAEINILKTGGSFLRFTDKIFER